MARPVRDRRPLLDTEILEIGSGESCYIQRPSNKWLLNLEVYDTISEDNQHRRW